MIITSKRIEKPLEEFFNKAISFKAKKKDKININSQIEIEVVKSFKLLSVHVDDRLNFQHNIKQVCSSINKKLCAIKLLSLFLFAVKMKLLKTFILSYFDYWISLSIYIPQANSINRIYNLYYVTLQILFKFK